MQRLQFLYNKLWQDKAQAMFENYMLNFLLNNCMENEMMQFMHLFQKLMN
jgi:hypothetical protein